MTIKRNSKKLTLRKNLLFSKYRVSKVTRAKSIGRINQADLTLQVELVLQVDNRLSNSEFNRIQDQSISRVNLASALWTEKCSIRVQIVSILSDRCQPGPRGTCIRELTTNGNLAMRNVMNRNLFFPPPRNNGVIVVPIFVLPGASFVDVPSRLGTTVTHGSSNSNYGLYIWVTLGAIAGNNPWIIAHEIGHALLNRSISGFPSHDPDPFNLMHQRVPVISNPDIRVGQCAMARQSRLLLRS